MRYALNGIAALLLFISAAAFGWGRDGHLIVGMAAEPLLCEAVFDSLESSSGTRSAGLSGLWADEIRSQPEWAHTAPWHYINIPDTGDPRNPPVSIAGNVITAIERFIGILGSEQATTKERANALRFLIHFVTDVHQPLHVGRAADRGGNRIDVTFDGKETNLHLFWDTDVISRRGLRNREYAESLSARVRATAREERSTDVRDWAAQVFALRHQVYDFDASSGVLSEDYLSTAEAIAERQLLLAAAHLANTLNELFCE